MLKASTTAKVPDAIKGLVDKKSLEDKKARDR